MNLIEATIGTHGLVVSDLVDGPLASAAGQPEGKPVTLGIRPESITLTTIDQGIPAVVELVEELGGSRIAYCAIGDKEVAVLLAAGEEELEGRTVGIHFDASNLHLFDRIDGKRIDMPLQGVAKSLMPETA